MAAYMRKTSPNIYYVEIGQPPVVDPAIAMAVCLLAAQTGRAISGVVAVGMTTAPRTDLGGWNIDPGAYRLEDLETLACKIVSEEPA